jgi:hypothetical protein
LNFLQLFAAVSLPTLIALVGVILNQVSNRTLAEEVKNFRIEMADKLGALTTRIAVVETKLGVTPPPERKPL